MNPVDVEILWQLDGAPAPLTGSELAPNCPSAADRTSVSRALHRLRTEGLVRAAEERLSHAGQGARLVRAYAITDEGIGALDAARAESQKALMGPNDGAPEDERSAAADLPVCDEDPVISELGEVAFAPRVAIDHPEAHAERLRTLAVSLELMGGGRTPLTQAWLRGLADLLDPEGDGR